MSGIEADETDLDAHRPWFISGIGVRCSCADQDDYTAHLAEVIAPLLEEAAAGAWESGVRQAMTWLRADYPYGTGPDWREDGAEWIADRLAEHHRDVIAELRDKPTKGEQS